MGRCTGTPPSAPVHDVPAEMHRLVAEMQSDQFQQAHSVVQAAFAHHVLTSVHPFADGNGRTARALASVFLYRAAGVPLVVFSDQRQTYFDALEDADAGRCRALVTFIDDRAMDTMALVTDHLRDALRPLDQQVASIRRRLVAHGGLTHGEVQAVAWRLTQRLDQAFNEQLGEQDLQERDVQWRTDPPGFGPRGTDIEVTFADQPYHALPEGGKIVLSLTCDAPFRIETDTLVAVGISNQAVNSFAFIVVDLPRGTSPLKLRVADLHPAISAAAEARIEGWARGVLSTVLGEFYAKLDRALLDHGYE
jgi:hypothetical protein